MSSSNGKRQAAGNFFNKHSFDYFNDIGSGTALIPLATPQSWVVGSDNVHGGMLTHLNGFTDEASAISGTSNTDFSAGVGVAVGFDANVMSKENSIGGSFGYTQSTSKGLLTMIDINGDGLPDKLFLDAGSNGLYYRPNLSGTTGKTGFGDMERMRRAFVRAVGQPPRSVRRTAIEQRAAAGS